MRLYFEFARRGYRRHAAYPAATIAGLFTNTVFGFMQAYILLALYRRRDDIGGYDASDAVTYAWLAQALIGTLAIFGWNELALRIRSGDIATDLARPVGLVSSGLAFDVGRGVYHSLYRGIPPFIVGALVFDLTARRAYSSCSPSSSVSRSRWGSASRSASSTTCRRSGSCTTAARC